MCTLLGQKSLNNAANADTARTECKYRFFLWTTLLKFGITIRLGVWMAWISLHRRSSARKVWDYFFVIAHLSQWKSASIRNGQLQKGCHFRIVIIKIVTKIIKWNLLIQINFFALNRLLGIARANEKWVDACGADYSAHVFLALRALFLNKFKNVDRDIFGDISYERVNLYTPRLASTIFICIHLFIVHL